MRLNVRYLLALLVLLLFVTTLELAPAIAASAESQPNKVYATYTSKEGIKWISYSKKWDVKGLKQLNQELLRNTHGEELYTLKEVVVYPAGISDEKGVMGQYVHLHTGKRIELALGDYRSLQEITRTLAHEYGHHFTLYYLNKADSFLEQLNAWDEWVKIRSLDLYPIDSSWNAPYEWQPDELIVNDYIMFYASPQARLSEFNSDPARGFELVLLREPFNKEVTYGDAVPGLRDYWEKKTGIPTTSKRLVVPKLHSINIEEQRVISPFTGSEVTYYDYTFYFSGMNTNTSYVFNREGIFFCPVDEQCDEKNFLTVSEDELDNRGLYALKLNSYNLHMGTNAISVYAFDPVSGNYAQSLRYEFIENEDGSLTGVPYNMIGDPEWDRLYDPKVFKKVSVFVNNVQQSFVNQPQIINGSTFVPFRELMVSLGATVRWDATHQTVHATLGEQRISFVPNTTEIVINGTTKTLSPAPKLIDGVTYVPMRFIVETLGAKVSWQGKLNAVYITK